MGYYGASLLSKSHTVFYVSLAAHLSQLAFLCLVESPHMDKIYGDGPERKPPCQDQIFFFHSNWRHPSHMLTLFAIVAIVTLHVFGTFSSTYILLQCLVVRVAHVGICGGILRSEEASQFFSKLFSDARDEAFEYWKTYCRHLLTMM